MRLCGSVAVSYDKYAAIKQEHCTMSRAPWFLVGNDPCDYGKLGLCLLDPVLKSWQPLQHLQLDQTHWHEVHRLN